MAQQAQLGFLGICVGVGLITAGALVGGAMKDMRRADRYVAVKGLVEREVMADLAIWTLKTKVAGFDLAATQRELEANVLKIRAFLKTNGFDDKEVEVRGWRVVDRKAQEYGEARADQMRFIIEATVVLRSSNVEKVAQVSQMTSELVKVGVTLAEENTCNTGPEYLFTKLNEIKPDMLAEATKNARAAAQQFAADSGSEVGGIKQANQGYFSITSRDQGGEEGSGGGCSVSNPNKKVRVVTTIDYYLED